MARIRTRPVLLRLLATAGLVGALSFGCAAGTGDAGPSLAKVTTGPEERSSAQASPPESTLTYKGRTVTGGLGAYCWSGPSGGQCVDGAADLPEEALKVPLGATPTFDYGGDRLTTIRAATRLAEQSSRMDADETRNLRVRDRRKSKALIDLAGLSAGDYVIEVFVRVSQGDVSYYFRVVVE